MLAAAVAFYATFSIAPLLLLLLNAGALLFGEATTRQRLLDIVRAAVGPRAAQAVRSIFETASDTDAAMTIVTVVVVLLSASAVFRHLRRALNLVLDVPTKEERGVLRFVKVRVVSALVAIAGIAILLAVLGVTTTLAWLRSRMPEAIHDSLWLGRAAEITLLMVLLTVLFGAILKFVPDIELRWRHVAMGAGFGAVVFVCGQLLLSAYVSQARPAAAYGTAASIILLLLYIYFTVAIVLAAAEFIEVVARRDDTFRTDRRRLQSEGQHEPRKQGTDAL